MVEGRRCAADDCDQVLTKRDGERPAKFLVREYCSKVCAARSVQKRRKRLKLMLTRKLAPG